MTFSLFWGSEKKSNDCFAGKSHHFFDGEIFVFRIKPEHSQTEDQVGVTVSRFATERDRIEWMFDFETSEGNACNV